MNEVQLFYAVKVDLLFAQCNDEKVMVNNGRNVKGRERGMRVGQRREEGNRFRECRRGHQRKRADNEEELCIIKARLN